MAKGNTIDVLVIDKLVEGSKNSRFYTKAAIRTFYLKIKKYIFEILFLISIEFLWYS